MKVEEKVNELKKRVVWMFNLGVTAFITITLVEDAIKNKNVKEEDIDSYYESMFKSGKLEDVITLIDKGLFQHHATMFMENADIDLKEKFPELSKMDNEDLFFYLRSTFSDFCVDFLVDHSDISRREYDPELLRSDLKAALES